MMAELDEIERQLDGRGGSSGRDHGRAGSDAVHIVQAGQLGVVVIDPLRVHHHHLLAQG